MSDLTVERLRELLDYDPATGVFTWRLAGRKRRIGALAGRISSSTGYWQIGIDMRRYGAHRLAWFYVHGEWPTQDTDHINCDRADNRLANLRPATRSQNKANARLMRTNTSGLKGVSFRRGKWRAQIQVLGKKTELGLFNSAEEAHQAYRAAAVKSFNVFARAA